MVQPTPTSSTRPQCRLRRARWPLLLASSKHGLISAIGLRAPRSGMCPPSSVLHKSPLGYQSHHACVRYSPLGKTLHAKSASLPSLCRACTLHHRPSVALAPSTYSQEHSVFNFFPAGLPAEGLDELVAQFRALTPRVKLAGPTSFAPAIDEGMSMVAASGNERVILVIIADSQVFSPLPWWDTTQPTRLTLALCEPGKLALCEPGKLALCKPGKRALCKSGKPVFCEPDKLALCKSGCTS
eukprot:358609-Chlamydomonas_euryale.AAC.1